MFARDRLDDDYEFHQRRYDPLVEDELDALVADARVIGPRWYNVILVQVGDGLMAIGRFIKERNGGSKSTWSAMLR